MGHFEALQCSSEYLMDLSHQTTRYTQDCSGLVNEMGYCFSPSLLELKIQRTGIDNI